MQFRSSIMCYGIAVSARGIAFVDVPPVLRIAFVHTLHVFITVRLGED